MITTGFLCTCVVLSAFTGFILGAITLNYIRWKSLANMMSELKRNSDLFNRAVKRATERAIGGKRP